MPSLSGRRHPLATPPLTASDGAQTITATYDRLNRVLATSDSLDSGAATSYTYSLTAPQWTDPTGTYLVTLDRFDRAVALDDPATSAGFTWAYRADGQTSSYGQPNGNTTAYGYDAAGRPASSATTAAGPVARASYAWTRNRAGQVLSEAAAVAGDPTNGTRSFSYDPLARLTAFSDDGWTTATAYGWDAVPNRTAVQVTGGPSVPTTYDAANRPQAQDGVANAFASDADGRLTARPDATGAAYQRMTWDSLGRLTSVLPPSGSTPTATYTYDPLDRLRMADYGSGNRARLRYVGLTTSIAQEVNDATGTVIRSIGNSWAGDHLEDWTGAGSSLRIYGVNGHGDVTWTAGSTGSVTGTVRYDPWGTATSVTGSMPDFRFQGSWADDATKLSWVITRWYAPAQGRFISEDSLLGQPRDPDSRHLYAYGAGEPVGRSDPGGRYWYRTGANFAVPATLSRTIRNPRRVQGRFEFAWFISQAESDVRVVGNLVLLGHMSGDNRGWASNHVPCNQSRGCVVIDFDHKTIKAQVNPTCGTFWLSPTTFSFGCTDQFRFNCSAFLTENYNCLRIVEDPLSGRLVLRWSLTQSRMPVIRPDRTIEGSLTISPGGSRGGTVAVTGNEFPKQELYYFMGSGRETLMRTGQSWEPNGMSLWGSTTSVRYHTYWV